MKIIDSIKEMLGTKLKRDIKRPYFFWDLLRNGFLDVLRYVKHSNTLINFYQKDKLEAQLYKECHRIEKGMSLSEISEGFGIAAFQTILQHLTDLEKIDPESEAKEYAGAVVKGYLELHREFEFNDQLKAILDSITGMSLGTRSHAGTIELTRAQLQAGSRGTFEQLVACRHSVRQYRPEKVDVGLLQEAARLASRTPSVCNRQAFRVRFFNNKERVDQLLRFQNGNLAFRNEIPVVAVISVDLRFFEGAGERNQAYVDGGLFAMSLVYGLHFVGLGTCFLNWSVRHDIDKAFRKVAFIPETEVIITLLSVGNLKETFKVAASPNKEFGDLFQLIED